MRIRQINLPYHTSINNSITSSSVDTLAGGAKYLLMARVDTDMILLVGRWCSDAMLRYLHMTAQTFLEGLAARMVQHGD